ncbi:MAG: helix-turn-helix transcriptional regulator [Rhodobacteraceae bacterium]|nr:helix-turn-helix transcriptional regulator [Paracoccaceae bacterium]
MSYRIKIDPKSRKAARFISQLQIKIQKALASSGKTQQEVAEILGVDRSVISRRLQGSANLTARSMAEFAYAFDKDLVVEFVDKAQTDRVNWTTASDNDIHIPKRDTVSPSGTIYPNSKYYLESAAQ